MTPVAEPSGEVESSYRRGFEAALNVKLRGKTYEEALSTLSEVYGAAYRDEAFRHGYERGLTYQNRQREMT